MVSGCWSDEDFIGRVSRVHRATHGGAASVATMRRCLGLYKGLLDKTFAAQRR